MNRISRLLVLVAACLTVWSARAQNTVFNAALAGDALNPATYPAVTSTTTGWDVLSNKAAPAPTESGGVLTINMAGTSSGFVEAQALFAAAPVQLLPGTYLEVTATFVPTYVLTNNSDNLIFGLFNSGGSAPLNGLLNSGLSSSLTTFATGGAKGWIGYNANIPISGSTPKMLTRPAQTGTNNTVQDVLIDSQSTSVGYSTPAGVSASSISAMSTTLSNGATYTLSYKLSLSADGLTLTAAVALYNGEGTGTGANTLIGSYTGKFSGSTLLTKSFDAFAIGWRADAGTSNPSNLKLSAFSVKTTGGAPWFTAQPPTSLSASIGSSLTIPAATGGSVSSYQWQVSTNGGGSYANIDIAANPSAATASLTLSNVQYSDAGLYRLVATNTAGASTSSSCAVTVSATPVAPSIITNPASATVTGGASPTFSVSVNGTSPLSYQWEKSTDGVSFTPISGATSASYTVASASLADEGYYRVTITNVAGSVTSAAAQLTVNQPLAITAQPVGTALNLGDNYTLSVTAVGKPAPTYQWYLNGSAISGATNSTYAIASAAAANAGLYSVVASNTAGDSVTSANAAVAVLSPTLATTATTPAASASGLAPDTRLTLTFNQPIAVGVMGTIKIYDASNPTTPVDTIDLVTATARMKTLRAAGTTSTQALPVENKTIGGVTNFNYYPITISGSTATIYPRNGVLAYNKTYFVTIDPGVFTDSTGLAFAGVSGSSGWTFSTRTVGPLSSATRLVVAADGSGDFCTVQGAIDFIPSGNTTPRTIFIRKGTYFEQVYVASRHALTFLGEDRAQTKIVYPNNNTFNNVSGTYHRMVFNVDHANSVALVNLSITNSTPKGGSQAEALILNGSTSAQAIVSNVDLFSYQDTFLSGPAYVTDSHISGDVDFMWGGGPCFFNNCELTMLSSGGYFTQIRNGSGNHGYVYVNCRFNAPAGVTGSFLGRIDPAGFPYSEVVILDSQFGNATNNAFLNTTTGISGSSYAAGWWLLNSASNASGATNVHNWTNNLVNSSGAALANPNTDAFTTMPTDATTQANYRNATWVLGNSWTPSLAPLIATAPTAQTIDAGGSVTLSVQAFGLPTLTYQWLRNGVAISGATSTSYAVPAVGAADAGMYSVMVSNGATSVTTTAVPLIVHGAAPVIALQPTNTTGLLGATATLNAWALGDGPFTYQWLKDGAAIAGATNQSLRLTHLQAADAGSYAVAITNAGGTTTSSSATLTLVAPAATMPTLPNVPAAIFDVTAYGAIGDGVTDNTAAIQAAINAAKAAGGGTIELPPAAGAYLCGPITLSSYMNLQIDAGATLRALPFGTYPKSTTAPSHFITINSASTDVEFSGGGTIDGDGRAWWAAFDAGTITARPRLVQINKSSNMLFTGVTLLNSPNFNLAFSGANNNVTIFGVTVTAPGDSPNTDGMDLAGTNYLVQKCSVSVGDDNIVAKPGSVFCRNIYIADCTIGTGHGVSIGGQTNVGLDGMTVTNCTFNGTSSAIRMKADPTQGGPVQNVTYSNLTMTNVTYPILFYSYYNVLGSPGATSGSSQITPTKVNSYNATPPNSLASSTIPTWKNITITNLAVTNGTGYCTIWGLPLAAGLIQNVTLNNVTVTGGAGLELYDAANIQFTGATNLGPVITCNALAITGQPQSKTVNVGDTVTFSATAVGGSGTNNTGLTYQWTLNGTPLSNGLQSDGSTISGATTATLTITNARVTRAGSYAVTVSTTLDGYNTSTSALMANSLPVSATSAAAALTVNALPATIALSELAQTYTGTPRSVSATTTPAGLPVSFTYAGNATAPTNAGSYAVFASIADPNYAGSASGTLVIAKAAPSVVVTPYSLTYDGQSHTAQGSATGVLGESLGGLDLSGTTHTSAGSYTDAWAFTDVSGNYNNAAGTVSDVITKASAMIAVTPYHVIYDGSAHTATGSALGVSGEALAGLNLGATTHTNAGSYSDGWSFTDLTGNYANASGTVTDSIAKAVASITLAPLAQRYDGTPKRVTATTTPSGLAVNLTYDGGTTAPIYPGPHTVVAIVDDANYVGTQTDTLTISVTALVRHAPTLDGVIDGSIETLLPENAALNATASISGDLLVPGSPIVNVHRQATYAGTLDATGSAAPANYTVALNAGAVLRHVVRRVDAIALPTVATPPAPTGTRDVTLDGTAGGVALAPGTYGALAVGGNATLVLGVVGGTEPVVYNFQSLTLSGTAAIEIAGPVEITIARGAALGGRVGLGAHPEWLVLRVANDGASASADTTLNGNAVFYGSLIVPGGTVTLAGNAAVHGNIIADRLTLSGGLLADPVP